MWWFKTSLLKEKLPMGKVQKKTNNTAFSATHTYIKLTLASLFLLFLFTFPLVQFERDNKTQTKMRHLVRARG